MRVLRTFIGRWGQLAQRSADLPGWRMTESVPQRLSRGLSAPTLVALAIVLVLITGTFALLLVDVRRFNDESKLAARSGEILREASEAERDLADIESGVR